MGWDQALREGLTESFGGKVVFDEQASAYTSLRVGGRIDALVFPENMEELSDVLEFAHRYDMPFLPVGNWTNLIVRDGGFRGIIISLSRLRKLLVSHQADGTAFMSAEAGCPLAEMVKTAAKESMAGLEFCAGIPGSVGGAIRMNAGAYGGEIKDIIESIVIIDKDGKQAVTEHKKLHFTYRNLDLPTDSIIIAGAFRLHKGVKKEIVTRMAEIIRKRKEKHPLDLPNAGSIFKNLPDGPAGRFIEESGLKGVRMGDAQISKKHANFIVNRGKATAGDIIALMDFVVQSVFEKTSRTLEPEVKIVGES